MTMPSNFPPNSVQAKAPIQAVDLGLGKSPFAKLSDELKVDIFERVAYHPKGIEVKTSRNHQELLQGLSSPSGVNLMKCCKTIHNIAKPIFLSTNVFHFPLHEKPEHDLGDDLAVIRDWLRGLGSFAERVPEIHAKSERTYSKSGLVGFIVLRDNGLHLGRVVEEIVRLTKAQITLIFYGVALRSFSRGDPKAIVEFSREQELDVVTKAKEPHELDEFTTLLNRLYEVGPNNRRAKVKETSKTSRRLKEAFQKAFQEKLGEEGKDDEDVKSENSESNGDGDDYDDESGDEETGDAEPADEEMHDSGSGDGEEEERDGDHDGDEEGEGDDGVDQDSEDEEGKEDEEADNEESDDEEYEEEGEEQDDEDEGDDDE